MVALRGVLRERTQMVIHRDPAKRSTEKTTPINLVAVSVSFDDAFRAGSDVRR